MYNYQFIHLLTTTCNDLHIETAKVIKNVINQHYMKN